jgi:hypothetical protein
MGGSKQKLGALHGLSAKFPIVTEKVGPQSASSLGQSLVAALLQRFSNTYPNSRSEGELCCSVRGTFRTHSPVTAALAAKRVQLSQDNYCPNTLFFQLSAYLPALRRRGGDFSYGNIDFFRVHRSPSSQPSFQIQLIKLSQKVRVE